jgi:Excalibur calcium-binding domain
MIIKFSSFAVLLILFTTGPALAKKHKPSTTNTAHSADSNNSAVLSKFKTCKEANRAGVSNVPVPIGYTPPGWNHSADRDNDGIACEKK